MFLSGVLGLAPQSGNVVGIVWLGFAFACFGIDLSARRSLTGIEVRRGLRSGIRIEWHRAWFCLLSHVLLPCCISILYLEGTGK